MKKIDNKTKSKVISHLESGLQSKDIAAKMGLTTQQVAAIKAHITMGTYK